MMRFYLFFFLSLFHTIPIHIPQAAVGSLLNAPETEKSTRLRLRLASGKGASLPLATDRYDATITMVAIKGSNHS